VALWLFGVRNYTPPGAAWSEDSAFHGASVAEQRKATGSRLVATQNRIAEASSRVCAAAHRSAV